MTSEEAKAVDEEIRAETIAAAMKKELSNRCNTPRWCQHDRGVISCYFCGWDRERSRKRIEQALESS